MQVFWQDVSRKSTQKAFFVVGWVEPKPIWLRTKFSYFTVPNMEDCTMDPHFNEYLAAVAGMLECYGKPTENNSFDSESCPSIKTDQTDCSSTHVPTCTA
ncbi:MAG TPA: hypothetical protein DD662_08155 [Planctomycetaceae bacterium]|nr:hypothetical protein [Planctomycetaceae bacterium]